MQLVHGDWHDGNILYQGRTVSGILDFDFAHSGLPLVDVAIAALIPGALGHVAFFIGRHADGDHGAAGQIRLGIDLLLRAG